MKRKHLGRVRQDDTHGINIDDSGKRRNKGDERLYRYVVEVKRCESGKPDFENIKKKMEKIKTSLENIKKR